MAKKNNFFIRKPNELFCSDYDWQNNACLNYSDGWYAYIRGYRKAAEILVQYINDNAREQDGLIYPIVFLYRQHVELLLKKIILGSCQLLDEEPKITEQHNIGKLWSRCKPIIIQILPDENHEYLLPIDKCIEHFMNIDPSSTSFRYPVDFDSNPSLPGLNHINTRNLSENITHVIDILEGVYATIGVYLDYKSDMLNDNYY
jgi:hypothetical protein